MKKKILVLSDHALSTSGVGVQTRHLISGLIAKGKWTFRQFGAAVKHTDYRTIFVNEDFIIKPIDGFGSRDLLRVTLAEEKPDAILIFTDPRFFYWLFEMEDEIHQICPIIWWHVWDNYPIPDFNHSMYNATDAINCHSYLTYEIVKSMFPDKADFIPHTLPQEMFFRMQNEEIQKHKVQILGESRKDHFVMLWINRNARRKRPADTIEAWSIFVKKQKALGKNDFLFIMHTDPLDQEGPNLHEVARLHGVTDTVLFSSDRVDFEKMRILHNISDCYINISYAEGFGLGTLEAMQCGNPIIALKTGGLTRQVIDHKDGSENGIALPVELRSLVGSQMIPYIYEDYVSVETTAAAIEKMYLMSDDERFSLGEKAKNYVLSEFNYQKMIDAWDESLEKCIDKFKSGNGNKTWEKVTI